MSNINSNIDPNIQNMCGSEVREYYVRKFDELKNAIAEALKLQNEKEKAMSNSESNIASNNHEKLPAIVGESTKDALALKENMENPNIITSPIDSEEIERIFEGFCEQNIKQLEGIRDPAKEKGRVAAVEALKILPLRTLIHAGQNSFYSKKEYECPPTLLIDDPILHDYFKGILQKDPYLRTISEDIFLGFEGEGWLEGWAEIIREMVRELLYCYRIN